MNPWLQRRCAASEGGVAALPDAAIRENLKTLSGWSLVDDAIQRTVRFKDYAETVAFVNAVAWIAQREDHHPDITFGYNACTVRYSTHAIGGISENDFICAARVDALLA